MLRAEFNLEDAKIVWWQEAFEEGFEIGFEESFRKSYKKIYKEGSEEDFKEKLQETLEERRGKVLLICAEKLLQKGFEAERISRVLHIPLSDVKESVKN